MMASAVNWFEIPVSNMDRALKFYNTIFEAEMTAVEAMSGFSMAMFPHEAGTGTGGAIVHGSGYTPSKEGTIVYLNGGEDLSLVLEKVADAGGEVLMPKTDIGENGFVAYFIDSEGNKVGLHSMG
jgi:predicted enzyme related to lactoylglutathione lyase